MCSSFVIELALAGVTSLELGIAEHPGQRNRTRMGKKTKRSLLCQRRRG
jgi:hypothetical protein